MSLKPEQIAASAVTLKPVTDGDKQEESRYTERNFARVRKK